MVFQHVAYELLGTLNPLLKQAGFRIRYLNFEREPELEPKIKNYNGLVILGGYMGAYEWKRFPHLKAEMRAIEEALEKDIPILGICLGAQLIAQTLGAKVQKHSEMEIGWTDVSLTAEGERDPVLAEFEKRQTIFHWHQDTFELPSEAEHLAHSRLCQNQAFRYGDKVYGFQFHLEVDEPMIHRWLKVPGNRKMLEHTKGRVSEELILKETHQHIQRSLALSRKVFSRFIDLFELPPRPILLGSGHEKFSND